ncbi:MAG: hypothetical protein ACRCYX_12105 [Dermatophilaceae bacterium]
MSTEQPHPRAIRGYRPAQVDDVVGRLQARIVELDAQIAAYHGEPPPTSGLEPGRSAPPTAATPSNREDMPVLGRQDSPAPPSRPDPLTGVPAPLRRIEVSVVAVYLLLAGYLMSALLVDVDGLYLSQGVRDHQAFEWYLGASAHNLATFSNPLFSDLQNYPDGVNLMANAAVIGLGLPLGALTVLAGPGWTFVVVLLLGFALTASGWYWVFRRYLPVHPVAAFFGGLLAGFAPGMVSHGNGHLNFVAQFLVPLIVDRVLRLARDGRTRRDGVVLGLMAAAQVFIGEEVLLLTAIGLAIGGIALLVQRRVDLRRVLPGLGVAAGVTLAIVAVPLWWQFAGPQSYSGIYHPPAGNDLAQLWGRATRSVGADPWASAALSINRTEENSFFGVPLWLAAIATAGVLWRSAVARTLAVVVAVTCWLSLGEEVVVHGAATGIPGPWAVVEKLPVIQDVLPGRLTLVAIPALAALLTLGVEVLRRAVRRGTSRRMVALAAGSAAALVALAPMAPTPLIAEPRDPLPAFFTGDEWKNWVDDGGSVLAAPPPWVADTRALEWQAAARWGFPVVAGYFVGPGPEPERLGQYGATPTLLTQWISQAANDDVPVPADAAQVAQFETDLRAGRVDAIVLPEGRPAAESMRVSLTAVFGAPTRTGGVYVWDVRGITDGD